MRGQLNKYCGNNMVLSKEQIKEAKKICKSHNMNSGFIPKNGIVGNGFWSEECKGSFEGFIEWLISESTPNALRDEKRAAIWKEFFEYDLRADYAKRGKI